MLYNIFLTISILFFYNLLYWYKNIIMKMYLTLNRIYFSPDYTIGKLYVDGVYLCDTLEDTNRDKNKDGDLKDPGETKVYGHTCIPFGTYQVKLTLSNRFKKVLPLLLNVPEFDGIRIHSGNKTDDTLGCILVGINDKKGWVSNSKETMDKLMKKLQPQSDLNQEIWITIK